MTAYFNASLSSLKDALALEINASHVPEGESALKVDITSTYPSHKWLPKCITSWLAQPYLQYLLPSMCHNF